MRDPVRDPVLVGELNPYGDRPFFALFDDPPNSAGGRMRRLVTGLPPRTYRSLHRHNLCVGSWSIREARAKAVLLKDHYSSKEVGFVLLGRKVSLAFGLEKQAPFSQTIQDDFPMVILPHPSGLCRIWNEPGAFRRAQDILRSVFPGLPWGGQALNENPSSLEDFVGQSSPQDLLMKKPEKDNPQGQSKGDSPSKPE